MESICFRLLLGCQKQEPYRKASAFGCHETVTCRSLSGCFVEHDANDVTSVSAISQMASQRQKTSIEEELKRQNRLLRLETGAIKSQLVDVEQVQRLNVTKKGKIELELRLRS